MKAPDRLLAMNAAHAAFRRDLDRLATTAGHADLDDPRRRAALLAGWRTFKTQMRKHHEGEDDHIWPRLRERLAGSENALSVLAEMDAEHARLDVLLKAVDDVLEPPGQRGAGGGTGRPGRAAAEAAVRELHEALSAHLAHEERDALPLIAMALSDAEWDDVMDAIRASADLAFVAEYLPWLADGATGEELERIETIVPPPFRAVYRQEWRPDYARTARW
ncbi:hemerythrin domain-containing protein [Actinomadura terrae]|uniref:hemerythrin domain-containing protein n=1 Tax=Actinomadura terrae TaxID=604353 RepID=UPI001FA6D64F|nr:hemerythrin domain-containing protein [Actinomadura terrae]